MKETNELLTIFMEECAEATVEASKLIRFGSDSLNNVHKMEVEVGDLLCMIRLLDQYGIIELDVVEEHADAKFEKLKTWSDLNLERLQ